MNETKYQRLHNAVCAEIERFDLESTRHKHLFRRFKYWGFFLTALATIIASANLLVPNVIQLKNLFDFLIVACTASAGIVAAIEGIRKPAELWMIERNIYHSLNDLKRELDYFGEKGFSDERLDELFDRLQATLYSSKQKWSKDIREEPQHEHGEQDDSENG